MDTSPSSRRCLRHRSAPRVPGIKPRSPSLFPSPIPLPRDPPSPTEGAVHSPTDGPPTSRFPGLRAYGKGFSLNRQSTFFLCFLPALWLPHMKSALGPGDGRGGELQQGGEGRREASSANQAPDLKSRGPEPCSLPGLGSDCLGRPGFETCLRFTSKNPRTRERREKLGGKESKETVLSSSALIASQGGFYSTDSGTFIFFPTWPLCIDACTRLTFIQPLLSARSCVRHFIYIIPCGPHHAPRKYVLVPPICREEPETRVQVTLPGSQNSHVIGRGPQTLPSAGMMCGIDPLA